jgi:osmotically-inducible protein OsmY
MRNRTAYGSGLALIAIAAIAGCSTGSTKSPEVTDTIRKDLDQARLGDVTVSQDRDKGVVNLGGHVASDADKSQAETIAKTDAPGQVVADAVAVLPPGADNSPKTVNADLDKGISENLDAELLQAKLDKGVKHDVKNGVVTLTGEVNSPAKRARVEKLASGVPNVQQVVNELEVKNQKATSTP